MSDDLVVPPPPGMPEQDYSNSAHKQDCKSSYHKDICTPVLSVALFTTAKA